MNRTLISVIISAGALFLISSSCQNKNGPEKPETPVVEVLSASPESLEIPGKGGVVQLKLSASSDWSSEIPGWLSLSPASGSKTEGLTLSVSAEANPGNDRKGEITLRISSGKRITVPVSQPANEQSINGKRMIVCANSMVYYGGFVQKGNQGKADPGMFSKLLSAKGYNCEIIDCTQGGHHLYDYTAAGCKTEGSDCTVGVDLLKGLDLASFDYVILSESGNNNANFLADARAVYKRFTDVNPNVKKLYINHIYSVYKKHAKVLDALKTLHDEDGVTIINCGQLGYDIYTGAVKVPGGSLSYSDRYTFCNHKSGDTHHPNPLMGYIMTQMVYSALTGESADYPDYAALIKSCKFAAGSTGYNDYYSAYYTTPAALPFMNVIDNDAEMKGIQQLIPMYIDKY